MSWKHPRFCRCHIYKNFFLFHGSIAEINGCFGWQNIAYQITLNCLFKKKKEKRKTVLFFFTAKQTLMVPSLTLLSVCWTRVQTLCLSLQHSTRPFLWISVSHSTLILLLLSCHFPKQVPCDFGKKYIYFWNFMLPLYSSQVYSLLVKEMIHKQKHVRTIPSKKSCFTLTGISARKIHEKEMNMPGIDFDV